MNFEQLIESIRTKRDEKNNRSNSMREVKELLEMDEKHTKEKISLLQNFHSMQAKEMINDLKERSAFISLMKKGLPS